MKNKTGISFVIGAIIGAGITWLLTSKEGKAVLEQLKKKTGELADEINRRMSSVQHDNTAEHE